MGELEISFLGICMHLGSRVSLPPGVRHRVVLVDAATETDTTAWGDLPPHQSFVAYNPGAAVEPFDFGLLMPLAGWRLTVPNADDTFDVAIDGVPSLREFDPSMQLRDDLLADGPPAKAAFFVDINQGHVRSHKFPVEDPGTYSSWKVKTKGAPIVRLEGRNGDAFEMVFPMESAGKDHYPFGIPGPLILGNTTLNATDNENDFVLHYLAAQGGIPSHLERFPHAPKKASPAFFGLTASCSNSQYP